MLPVNQHTAGDNRKVEIDPISCCRDMSGSSVNPINVVHIFRKTQL